MVFIQNGYRVGFYSYDLADRFHVHVVKQGHECKIWLDDLTVAFNHGFKAHEIAETAASSRNAASKSSSGGLNTNAQANSVRL